MTDTVDVAQFFPEKLRETFELYPKVVALTNYIIEGFFEEFSDVRFKYLGPDLVRREVINEIIDERGFAYITAIMDTLTAIDFNVLLNFLGVVNLLKGSREGLELVIRILGMDATIAEWWEQHPLGVPDTYVITILMNSSFVPDPSLTLEKIRVFAANYVYPVIENIDFNFQIQFAVANANHAGFVKARYTGDIQGVA